MSGTLSGANITGPNIPSNLQVPLFYADFDNTGALISVPKRRGLLIGQTQNAQTAQPIWIAGLTQAATLFGLGSMLYASVAAYLLNNPYESDLWALPLPDASGSSAATATLTVTGAATANGTQYIYVNGVRISVPVTSGMAATAMAAAIQAAVAAVPTIEVTATVSAAVVTFTANHKGAAGNTNQVAVNYGGARNQEFGVSGQALAVTAFTGGATDPDMTNLQTILGTQTFDFILHPYVGLTSLGQSTAAMSNISGRWSYAAQFYGHVWVNRQDSAAGHITFNASINDPHLSVIETPVLIVPNWRVVAAVVGNAAPSIRNQPNLPLIARPVQGIPAPVSGTAFTFPNQQALLTSGGSQLYWDEGAGQCRIQRIVTTYQTSATGVPDQSYLDVGVLYTLAELGRREKAMTLAQFTNVLLAADGTRAGAGIPLVTPKIYKAALYAMFRQAEADGLVQSVDVFMSNVVVQINPNNPARLDTYVPPNLVVGLEVVALMNAFRLGPATAVN